jgi:tetratricopeptide (TPR) repeat protein
LPIAPKSILAWVAGSSPERNARQMSDRARAAAEAGRHQEALDIYAEMVARFDADANPAVRLQIATALFNWGHTLAGLGRHDDAVQVFDRLIERYGRDDEADLMHVERAWVNKGASLLALHRPAEALAAFDQVVRVTDGAISKSERETQSRAWLGRAQTLAEAARYEEAAKAADRVVALASGHDLTDEDVFVAAGMLSRAESLDALGEFDLSVATYETLIDRFGADLEPRMQELIARAMVLGAAVEERRRPSNNAAAAWRRTFEWFADERLGLDPALREAAASAIDDAGLRQMERGALDDALVSFDRGLVFAETFGSNQVRGRLLNNKGVVLSKLGRWQDALEAYEASLAVRTSLDDNLKGTRLALVLMNKAEALVELGRMAEALSASFQAEAQIPPVLTTEEAEGLASKVRAEIARVTSLASLG